MAQQPNDTSGWTPVDDTSGWTPVDEQQSSQPSAIARGLRGLGEGIEGGISAMHDLAQGVQNPTSLVGPALQTVFNAQQTKNPIGRYAQYVAAAVPGIGPTLANQGQMISQGNIAQPIGQVIGGMIGGAATGVPRASAEFILQHPNVTNAIGTGLGAAGGVLLGEKAAPGYGGFGGGMLGGAYAGSKLAGSAIKGAESSAVEDVVMGKRSLESVPVRLHQKVLSALKSQEQAYADIAARHGITPEQMNIPVGLREGVKQLYEERARESASLPSLIQTPEQLAAQSQRAKAFGAQAGEMRPEASARGMAYAAGRHQTEWVPSKRGVETSTTQTFRRAPRIKEPQPPPK